ncbi:MAG: hypothetical protein KGL90_15470 [Burkholderiales bacterium]|nr:hypothetical protein [Burkholderiales bacterium]
MATRIVSKAFELNKADGTKVPFAVGDEVEGDLAEHWYVQHHSEDPKAKPKAKAEQPAQ